MLPEQYRLRKTSDFNILWKEGRFVSGTLLNAKVWRVEPEKYPKRGYTTDDLRIGFVVSTKISKSAVKRNRVKRQMREVFRLFLKEGKIKNGFFVAIVAKTNVLNKEYQEIEKSIIELLRRAKLAVNDAPHGN